ncbi:MAG: dihydropteridine reductase [Clostridia bacterium]|nr:dihydropteridine reductase [Clostridia bacterium]
MNTDKIYAESIAKEYAPKEDSKILALKKLDQKAKQPANIFAFTFGIISSLVAGLGMSLAMNVIGGTTAFMVLGIVIGIIGFACCGINYPIYKKILEKGKKKYAFEIVQLAREISEEK